MSNVLSLRIPKSLYQHLKKIAQEEGISINHLVVLAVAEKVATLQTVDYLEQRAARGCHEKLQELLAKAPVGIPLLVPMKSRILYQVPASAAYW